jgi:uncharacterized protein YpbB
MKPIIVDLKTKKNGQYLETVIIELNTVEKTKELIDRRLSIEEIASARGLTIGTIHSHILKLIDAGVIHISRYVDPKRQEEIEMIFTKYSPKELKPIKDLYPQYSYLELSAVKADLEKANKIGCYE